MEDSSLAFYPSESTCITFMIIVKSLVQPVLSLVPGTGVVNVPLRGPTLWTPIIKDPIGIQRLFVSFGGAGTGWII